MSQRKRESVVRYLSTIRRAAGGVVYRLFEANRPATTPDTLTAMRILILAMGVLCLSVLSAGQKQKKPPDVTVLEAKARRGRARTGHSAKANARAGRRL